MYISCKGITRDGVFCQKIDVELDISGGLFSFLIVGLADKCIAESRERIISAIKNSGFESPKTKNHKITVSLVPAGIKKEGVLLDLPISLAYLTAVGRINKKSLEKSIFVGELGLDGSIKCNNSLALIVNSLLKNQLDDEFSLYSNFEDELIDLINELGLEKIKIFKFENLERLISFLNKKTENKNEDFSIKLNTKKMHLPKNNVCKNSTFEIDEIIGQEKAKRAILISICGKYNIIMAGPPGVGKTKLARSMHQLLPTPKNDEYLEILSIHNKLERPFRTPHHTSSYTSIIGGGNPVNAGEITLAHKGILFLDELPEFNKNIIESLRQPLEQKTVQINRTGSIVVLPCDTICVCAMNLCPCGNTGIPDKDCSCSGTRINLYKQKISQPFLERFHISINLLHEKNYFSRPLVSENCDEKLTGSKMRKIIENFNPNNANFYWDDIVEETLRREAGRKNLSMRAIKHIREISETICLIENIEDNYCDTHSNNETKLSIKNTHVLEALSYKNNLFE